MTRGEELITVVIAEDDPLLGHFLEERLAGEAGLQVVESVGSGRAALGAARRLCPRVLLLDLGLPDLSGLEVLARLGEESAAPAALVLTGDEAEETELEAVQRGARGFLGKSQAGPALTKAIRAVAAGETWLPPRLVQRIVDDYPKLVLQLRERMSPVQQLTEKEREVLARIGRGMMNQEIAAELCLSVSSIKLYSRSIIRKLGLPNRAGAAAFAAREGLLDLTEGGPLPFRRG
jgi:DNA-binding NarL/FixJ family response regulator